MGPNTTLSFIAADDEPLCQSVADVAALAGTINVEPAQPKPLECAFHVDTTLESAFCHAFHVRSALEPALRQSKHLDRAVAFAFLGAFDVGQAVFPPE